ncbi:uncharacterized protein B0H64DRAFT_452231 [Chaetomium fimeti]|uniref:Uncharacterized protein n=1 Tax=Chaetomium fimeti TaxID=1854472 RepID=A0AAE0H6B7_9PEZI|nr:hypothetical protein B0H64DRAFT_452231 [Chaetomium fimeti]
MPTELTVLESLGRAGVEQEQARILRRMKEDLKFYPNWFLDQADFEGLGVIIGPGLDVDETIGDFSSTRFFRPWVPDEVVKEAADVAESTWMDKLAAWASQSPVDPRFIREGTGLDLPFHDFEFTYPYIEKMYISECAYFPVDSSIPHVACLVLDSIEATITGDRVLRSDLDFAIAMVLWRLTQGRHTNHHTKPALIYTLERDQHARITQAHFDGKRNKLVLRQSRHLDLSGPEPTPDAFLLLRWIACRPAGETEYADEEDASEDEGGRGERSPGVGPELLSGCA